MPTKNKFKKKFFCIVIFEGTFKSFFKDKKAKRSHKTVEILLFLLNDRRIRSGAGSIALTNGSGSGRPKNTWIRNTAGMTVRISPVSDSCVSLVSRLPVRISPVSDSCVSLVSRLPRPR
jgi:hypothetical protein